MYALTCMPCWNASSALHVAPLALKAAPHAASLSHALQPPGPPHPGRHSHRPVVPLNACVAEQTAAGGGGGAGERRRQLVDMGGGS